MKRDGRIAVTVGNDYIEANRVGVIDFINSISNCAMFYPIDNKPPYRIVIPVNELIINN